MRGSIPALAQARSITSASASLSGAVSVLDRPPTLFTATPLITACSTSPSRTARSSRFSTRTATASPEPVPAASAEKDRVLPSVERMPMSGSPVSRSASRTRLAQPTRASSASSSRRSLTAKFTAVMDDEHDESTIAAGPRSPKNRDSLPAIADT